MFNEKNEEWSKKQSKNIPVWQTDKYKESKEKAIEVIKNGKYGLAESDFWILMNETGTGKMAYTGLILSHNGCLKVNDSLTDKFRSECVSENASGWGNSLVFTYNCPEQGLYEVGEVSAKNCKIDYPYAMAFKRLFDRVVLKLSKLAYAGIYGEDEADEFRNPLNEPESKETSSKAKEKPKAEAKQETPKEQSAANMSDDEINAMFIPTAEGMIQNQGGVEFGICAKCGGYIYQTRKKGGGVISARDMIILGLRGFNQPLCKNCYAEAVKAAKASESANS